MNAIAPAAPRSKASAPSIYIAFVPWIVFSVLSNHDSLKAAAIAALIVAVGIAGRSIVAGSPKILELGAVVAFAGFSVASFALDPAGSDDLVRYARAIAAGLLALIALLSLLRTPFTEQYARDIVPREYWGSAQFKKVNRQLTLTWALVFAAMVPSHIVAGMVDTQRAENIFNWGVPILLVVFAIKRQAALTGDAEPS